jgi:hypothetical protein
VRIGQGRGCRGEAQEEVQLHSGVWGVTRG